MKFFIPVFWIVFFGAFTTASMMYQFEYFGNIPASTFRVIVVLFYLSGVAMFVFTLMRLVRVEADEQFLYVTNYFKTARYPYHNIEALQESDFLGFMLINVIFKESGTFGKRVNFVASKQLYRSFWEQHSDQKAAITSTPEK